MLLLTSSCATTKDREASRNESGVNQMTTAVSNEANARRENKAVVENFFARLEAMDIPGFIALWDEAGVQLMPFSPAGFPKELRGRAAIQKQYGGLPENYTGMRFTDRVYHEAIDPEIFIVEYHGEINVKATGKPYNNDYIGVFQVKNGKLVKFTEYFNPIILQESFGADLQKNFSVDSK
jgi:ketosteroid isomerase-like protein